MGWVLRLAGLLKDFDYSSFERAYQPSGRRAVPPRVMLGLVVEGIGRALYIQRLAAFMEQFADERTARRLNLSARATATSPSGVTATQLLRQPTALLALLGISSDRSLASIEGSAGGRPAGDAGSCLPAGRVSLLDRSSNVIAKVKIRLESDDVWPRNMAADRC